MCVFTCLSLSAISSASMRTVRWILPLTARIHTRNETTDPRIIE